MANSNVMNNNDIFLYNNMTETPLLENQIISQHNYALFAVVALSMLCYAQSKRFNIVQKVNTQFAFANNILKQFIELFHQMKTHVLYESLNCGLQANTKAVMEEILKKIQTRQFFISYNNMNFYKNVHNQRIFNRNALVSYTARYICFMKLQNGIENKDVSYEDEYIDRN